MNVFIRLKNRNLETVAYINEAPIEAIGCGVVKYEGNYYNFQEAKIAPGIVYITFVLTDCMEIKS